MPLVRQRTVVGKPKAKKDNLVFHIIRIVRLERNALSRMPSSKKQKLERMNRRRLVSATEQIITIKFPLTIIYGPQQD